MKHYRFCLIVCSIVAALLVSDSVAHQQADLPRITPSNAANIRELMQVNQDIHEIQWSPDGNQLALHGWETPVMLATPNTLQRTAMLVENKRVVQFAFSPNPETVAFCENGSRVEILNLKTKASLTIQTRNDQPAIQFSPDGNLIVTGGYGTEAKLWAVSSGRLVRSFDMGPAIGGLTPVFSPDGTLLAVGHRNAETRIFEVATGKLLHTLGRKMTQELKFHPDGKLLAVTYVDANVALWDVADGKLVHIVKTNAEELFRLDWSPRGEILATAGLKSKITLWNPKDMSILKEINGPEWVISLQFNPDGTRLLTAGGQQKPNGERRVQIWGVR